jgi:NAD(P)-dependent dehydrogenase (short-subunit alcohol dehydrogenase family)
MEIHKQLQRNRLAGRVVIVTGIAEPTGSAIALRLAAEGARLILSDASDELSRDTLREIELMEGTAAFILADACTDYGAGTVVQAALKRYGRIDSLVHNVAVLPAEMAEPVDGAVEVRVDFDCLVPLVCSASSAMALQGEGSIVLVAGVKEPRVSSALAVRAVAVRTVEGLVTEAAARLYEHGITVNGVVLEEIGATSRANGSPQMAQLNFVNAYRKARRFQDVAHTARFLASSEAQGISGQVFIVGGGLPPADGSDRASREQGASDYHELLKDLGGTVVG